MERRRLKREAEKAAEAERRKNEELRTEARLREARKQKEDAVSKIFGEGVCGE